MKNLVIYREPFENTKALFYLFLEQQPFTILSICCTMEMLIVTLRLYLIFYCKPLRQCIHISCPFTVQFTWRQKQEEFVSVELFLLNRHFPAHLQELPKGKSGIEISIFFSKIWKVMGIFKIYLSLIKVSLKYLLIDGLSAMGQSYTSNPLIVQSSKISSSDLNFVLLETASKFYAFPMTAIEFVFLQE